MESGNTVKAMLKGTEKGKGNLGQANLHQNGFNIKNYIKESQRTTVRRSLV